MGDVPTASIIELSVANVMIPPTMIPKCSGEHLSLDNLAHEGLLILQLRGKREIAFENSIQKTCFNAFPTDIFLNPLGLQKQDIPSAVLSKVR